MALRMAATWIFLAATAMPALAADDWKANAARMDSEAKAFDRRQSFAMPDACTAEYTYVSPNRQDVRQAKVDLKLVDGESVENAADNYTTQFNFSRVGFDCLRGQGRPNCTTDRYSFGHVPVKPGAEPAFCKAFLAVVASCQGVASFKPSRKGCQLPKWERDLIRNGPPRKERIPSPF